jgi:transcriptional regulator PpsR
VPVAGALDAGHRSLITTLSSSLAELDAEQVGGMLAAAGDLTLVIDDKGVIRDLAFGSDELAQLVGPSWLGQSWLDTVSDDSRSKVSVLLAAAAGTAAERRGRQVNQRLASGLDLPVQYTLARLPAVGRTGARILAFGRDQRASAALQQRLVEAQLSVERDYARFRQAELRYRHLFQVAGEAVLVVDAASSKVVEANPAAAELFDLAADKLVGLAFPIGLTPRSTRPVQSLLAAVRRSGRADPVTAELADGRVEVRVSATLVHQDNTSLLLVRLARGEAGEQVEQARAEGAMLLQLARSSPDSLVVTDLDGRVLSANAEFLSLTQMANEDLVRGQSLDRWLGRTGVDLGVLVSNLRQGGAVKLFATTLRGEFGASTEVEISAVMVSTAEPPFLGFTIRDVGRRLPSEGDALKGLPKSVNQLTELVGRVPLKDIVGETTDLIEKLCIEAALELTRDNRASAAEILGLSRQSLYVKLRRYGLGDLGPGADH